MAPDTDSRTLRPLDGPGVANLATILMLCLRGPPIEDASVDYVVANMYLHHVDEPATAIHEAVRILKPSGAIALTDLDAHSYAFLRREHHDRWLGFAHDDVRDWFAGAGLERVEVRPIGSTCEADSSDGATRASIRFFLAIGTKPSNA